MSFIDVKPNDAKELEVVPDGEYELAVISAELAESKSKPGQQQIALSFSIQGVVNAPVVRHWLQLPHASDDDATTNRKLLRLKQFCDAFDYDASNGLDTEDLTGLTGTALLSVENNEEYGDQNRIKRFV